MDGDTSGLDADTVKGNDVYPITVPVAVSATGTSINFTSIPSYVKRITIGFAGVSTNGTSRPFIQIGDSGGIETSGYVGSMTATQDSSPVAAVQHGNGWFYGGALAANTMSGQLIITKFDTGTTWMICGVISLNANATIQVAGYKALSGTLDRVRITTNNGTDGYDAGTVNIVYE